ncbi:MAG: DUF3830 family protein [Mesorhizobium sp.]|uniref:DUF3830 family protein n=1 Tax=Mesorhizobium sp. TaxID=1871066 RepID=UPI000FE801DE|nr:MAG: DUF3830 family protein [Mesorhizobium sp.]
MKPEYVSLGLRKRQVSVQLKLRWDKSPWTCEQILDRLPIEDQVWHARWAHNEIYTLIPAGNEVYKNEWRCIYPAPGDLMYIPLEAGFNKLPGTARLDTSKDHFDIAYFYERGSNLYGPSGPSFGNIFATATDLLSLEEMAKACSDVWFSGAVGEKLYLEVVS